MLIAITLYLARARSVRLIENVRAGGVRRETDQLHWLLVVSRRDRLLACRIGWNFFLLSQRE
jgi:hypothetical protein